MSVIAFEAGVRQRRARIQEQRQHDAIIAREAFHRGLKLGGDLARQRANGPVALQPPEVSKSNKVIARVIYRPTSALAAHAYVVAFMAAAAFFLVFWFHL